MCISIYLFTSNIKTINQKPYYILPKMRRKREFPTVCIQKKKMMQKLETHKNYRKTLLHWPSGCNPISDSG